MKIKYAEMMAKAEAGTLRPRDVGMERERERLNMTKIQREELRDKIWAAIDAITAGESNRDSVAQLGSHTVARRLVYAGGSQWTGCGRDWDRTECGWAWVVDEQYTLTQPRLFGFDGHNRIERQTDYYLQDGYDSQTTPQHDGRDPLSPVPNRILLELGRAIVAARKKVQEEEAASELEADKILTEI